MDPLFEITIVGKPEPRGSKTSVVLYKNRQTKEPLRREDGSIMSNVLDTNESASKAWMRIVEIAVRSKWRAAPIEGGLDVVCVFFVKRPDGHYGTGRNARLVKDSSPARPTVRPDLDKIGRSTLDALSGLVWRDDSQIVGLSMDKRYAVPKSVSDPGEGVFIAVQRADQQRATDLDIDLRQRWMPGGEIEAEGLFAVPVEG